MQSFISCSAWPGRPSLYLGRRRGRESETLFLRVYSMSCSKIYVCSCLTAWIAPFDVHRSFLPTGAPG